MKVGAIAHGILMNPRKMSVSIHLASVAIYLVATAQKAIIIRNPIPIMWLLVCFMMESFDSTIDGWYIQLGSLLHSGYHESPCSIPPYPNFIYGFDLPHDLARDIWFMLIISFQLNSEVRISDRRFQW